MTKQNGLGAGLLIDGYDLSGDIGSLQRIGGGPAPLVVTGIDKEAIERIGGKRDGGIAYQAWFNPATGQAHDRLSALPTTNTLMMYAHRRTIGAPAVSQVAKQVNYDGTRGNDGSFAFNIDSQSNGYGIEWGRLLTALPRTDTGATNGASVDLGSASPGAFGLTAWLHVTAFTGTDVTIAIEESSDDGGADAFAAVTGGAFTAVTGITSERIATGAINVERYLRVVTSTSGGFISVSFVVMVTRHDTLTVY